MWLPSSWREILEHCANQREGILTGRVWATQGRLGEYRLWGEGSPLTLQCQSATRWHEQLARARRTPDALLSRRTRAFPFHLAEATWRQQAACLTRLFWEETGCAHGPWTGNDGRATAGGMLQGPCLVLIRPCYLCSVRNERHTSRTIYPSLCGFDTGVQIHRP
jgi:hypothetical protein